MSSQLNDLISQGVGYLQRGNRAQARQLFDMAIKLDDNNLQAWWWLTQATDDDQMRLKLDKHTREIAARVPKGRETYTQLLEQSGVPQLMRYKLVATSKSTGDQCPVDTCELVPDDIVIVCPVCHRASHVECWEENLNHCGHFACSGMGLIVFQGPIAVEPELHEEPIVVETDDIPEETPWGDRESKEGAFVMKLVERQIDEMVREQIRQEEEHKRQEEMKRRAAEQQRAEAARRGRLGFFGGLLAGVFFAYAVYQYYLNWPMALLTVYLCASGFSAAAKSAYFAQDRLTSLLYSLLPEVISAFIMFSLFAKWNNGWIAVVGSVISFAILEGLLRVEAIYTRRALITYSVLGMAGLLIFYRITH
jgi:hypothetical protein